MEKTQTIGVLELTAKVMETGKLTREDARIVVDALFGAVEAGLAENRRVKLPGIGILRTKVTKERTGRNPRTGEPCQIPSKRKIMFKALTAF